MNFFQADDMGEWEGRKEGPRAAPSSHNGSGFRDSQKIYPLEKAVRLVRRQMCTLAAGVEFLSCAGQSGGGPVGSSPWQNAGVLCECG